MKMTRQLKSDFLEVKWIVLISAFICASCVRTFRLPEADKSWMPYHGNETLVFNSKSEGRDTVFLIGRDTLWAYPDPIFSVNKYEIISVFSRFKDMYDDSIHYRYLESTFFSIKRKMSASSELSINFKAKNATFYRFNPIKIDSLQHVQATVLKVGDTTYDDVYIIDSDGGDFYKDRSDFVARIYWSKSSGAIRFDKLMGEYWELVND